MALCGQAEWTILYIKEYDQQNLDFGIQMSCFLPTWRLRALPMKALGLFFGLYLKIHYSSPAMTLPKMSGLILRGLNIYWHTYMRLSFWSLFSSFAIIFAKNFRMSKSSVRIFMTLSQFTHTSILIHDLSSIIIASNAPRVRVWVIGILDFYLYCKNFIRYI